MIELNPDYTVSRYPDAANGIPAKMYSFKKAVKKLASAKRIMAKVEKWMK